MLTSAPRSIVSLTWVFYPLPPLANISIFLLTVLWPCSKQYLQDKILSFEIASKLAHQFNFYSNLALSSLVTGCQPPPQNVLVLKPTPMATHWECLAAAGPRCQPLECILCTSVSASGLVSWPAFSKVSSPDSSDSSACCSCSCGTEAKAIYRGSVSPFQKPLACTISHKHTLSPFSMWNEDVPLACTYCGGSSVWIDKSTLVNLTDTNESYISKSHNFCVKCLF